jgi:hypothetical protein
MAKIFRERKFFHETFGDEQRQPIPETAFYTSVEWLGKEILEREKEADGVEIHLVYRLLYKDKKS